jgi:hypothetical protein
VACVPGLLRSWAHTQMLSATAALSACSAGGLGSAYGVAARALGWAMLDWIPRRGRLGASSSGGEGLRDGLARVLNQLALRLAVLPQHPAGGRWASPSPDGSALDAWLSELQCGSVMLSATDVPAGDPGLAALQLPARASGPQQLPDSVLVPPDMRELALTAWRGLLGAGVTAGLLLTAGTALHVVCWVVMGAGRPPSRLRRGRRPPAPLLSFPALPLIAALLATPALLHWSTALLAAQQPLAPTLAAVVACALPAVILYVWLLFHILRTAPAALLGSPAAVEAIALSEATAAARREGGGEQRGGTEAACSGWSQRGAVAEASHGEGRSVNTEAAEANSDAGAAVAAASLAAASLRQALLGVHVAPEPLTCLQPSQRVQLQPLTLQQSLPADAAWRCARGLALLHHTVSMPLCEAREQSRSRQYSKGGGSTISTGGTASAAAGTVQHMQPAPWMSAPETTAVSAGGAAGGGARGGGQRSYPSRSADSGDKYGDGGVPADDDAEQLLGRQAQQQAAEAARRAALRQRLRRERLAADALVAPRSLPLPPPPPPHQGRQRMQSRGGSDSGIAVLESHSTTQGELLQLQLPGDCAAADFGAGCADSAVSVSAGALPSPRMPGWVNSGAALSLPRAAAQLKAANAVAVRGSMGGAGGAAAAAAAPQPQPTPPGRLLAMLVSLGVLRSCGGGSSSGGGGGGGGPAGEPATEQPLVLCRLRYLAAWGPLLWDVVGGCGDADAAHEGWLAAAAARPAALASGVALSAAAAAAAAIAGSAGPARPPEAQAWLLATLHVAWLTYVAGAAPHAHPVAAALEATLSVVQLLMPSCTLLTIWGPPVAQRGASLASMCGLAAGVLLLVLVQAARLIILLLGAIAVARSRAAARTRVGPY